VIAVAAAVALFFSAFIVYQTQQALVLQFGDPVQKISEPGLYWRTPIVQTVEYFDNRILDLETDAQEVIGSDQKRLVVDAYARYRITDPLQFYQAFRTEAGARRRLVSVVDSTLRGVLAQATFTEIVRSRREELMKQIAQRVSDDVRNLGLKIVDVRIKRVDLPEANTKAIFARMTTERNREATELRAEGDRQALKIKADADRQVTVILAEANRDADKVRGDGDAERNRIYADAYGRDPDFFGFYRSMQSYEEALQGKDTRVVLSPNSEFFRYFTNATPDASAASVPSPAGSGRAAAASPAAK
jgi:membrane protease subunit HflC